MKFNQIIKSAMQAHVSLNLFFSKKVHFLCFFLEKHLTTCGSCGILVLDSEGEVETANQEEMKC